ncbi:MULTISPECIES: sensor histidine kinase [Plantibacter]|uniref:sensor histidine kinase n=1 Tax=Plantibacter TaxID=190323 RepID=UPI00254F41A4|nr:sensor histidine kinase [Plantibacter sp. lyk4-40-MEA-4]
MAGRSRSIASRLFLVQLVAVVAMTLVAGVLLWFQARTETEDRAVAKCLDVANGVADNPYVVAQLGSERPSDALQPYAEALMRDTGVDFVTIMAPDRTRYTHRERDQIGKPFIGTIGPALEGGTFTETYTGTLGPSVRAVAPIRDGAGEVVALVAAGVTVSNVSETFETRVPWLLGTALLVLVVGAIGSWTLRRYLARVTGSRGPEDLARMFDYYESVLHSVREGLVLVDRHRRLVLVNDQAAELLGLPLGERSPGAVPVDELPIDAGLRELLASGRQAVDEIHLTREHVLVVNQESAVGPGETAGPHPRGWVMTLRDHTEIEHLSGELASMRTMSDALRSQTHEFANRLHTIVSLIELDRREEALDLAAQGLGASQRLTDRVLAAEHEPVISALLLGKTAQAAEQGVELHLESDPALGRVRVDPAVIVTILGNLIDNAIDAAAGDRPWVEVYLGQGLPDELGAGRSADAETTELVIQVTDSGPGLPPEALDVAFVRGWSTKEPGRYGRGFGLALVQQAVTRLDGTIEVVREPSSAFVVTLPAAVGVRDEAGT